MKDGKSSSSRNGHFGADVSHKPSASLEVHLREFEAVRQAIRARVDSNRRYLYFYLAATGAVLSYAVTSEHYLVMTTIPLLAPFIYLDRKECDTHIGACAQYIRDHLKPQMTKLVDDPSIMQFENFLEVLRRKGSLHLRSRILYVFLGTIWGSWFLSWAGADQKALGWDWLPQIFLGVLIAIPAIWLTYRILGGAFKSGARPTAVSESCEKWLKEQASKGVEFNDEQRQWLEQIAQAIALGVRIEREDFSLGWFAQHGDLGRAYELFGERLETILAELNERLVA